MILKFLLPISLLVLLAGAVPVAGEIPASVPGERPGASPLWISADEAIQGGELRADLFSPYIADEFRRQVRDSSAVVEQLLSKDDVALRALAARPCTTDIFTVLKPPADNSLSARMEEAEIAFQGTVVEREHGFFRGHMRTLLGVEVERWLKRGKYPAGEAPTHVFVVYNGFRFEVEGEVVCHRPMHHTGEPAVGGRILAFAGEPETSEPPFFWPSEFQLFFERADGTVSLPVDDESLRPGWGFIEERLEALKQPLAHRPVSERGTR